MSNAAAALLLVSLIVGLLVCAGEARRASRPPREVADEILVLSPSGVRIDTEDSGDIIQTRSLRRAGLDLHVVRGRRGTNQARLQNQATRLAASSNQQLIYSASRAISLPIEVDDAGDISSAAAALLGGGIASVTTDWNKDRIDQHNLPLDGNYDSYGAALAANGGSPLTQTVHVHVVDVGVADHINFPSMVQSDFNYYPNEPAGGCHPHATHVAGIVFSITHGVAPDTHILMHSEKALDCTGSGTTVGLAQALLNILNNLELPAIINLSLSMSGTDAVLESLLGQLRSAGALIVAAAGNSNSDACGYFPAGSSFAVSVGSSAPPSSALAEDTSSFSNYGNCVKVYAPGESILSTMPGNSYALMSGTSMAAPMFVGVVVLKLFRTRFALSPLQAADQVIAESTLGVLPHALSKRLVFAGNFGTVTNAPTTPAPTPSVPTTPAPSSPIRQSPPSSDSTVHSVSQTSILVMCLTHLALLIFLLFF